MGGTLPVSGVSQGLNPGPPPHYLGIEIGGTKLQLVVGDTHGHIIHRWQAAVNRQEGGPGICRQIEQGLGVLRGQCGFRAVGVGFGGPVDWRSGRICTSHQVPGWEGFELRKYLQDLTGLPVVVDNDANVAALGEALSGAGRGATHVFFITMGSGMGGGLVVNGQIYHGLAPGECEFGQLRLDRQGTTVESRCCGWAVDARIRQLRDTHPESMLCRLIGPEPGGEAKYLRQALDAGDPAAWCILRELADDLGFAFSHVVHLLHPQRLILGTGLSLIGEPLRAAVAEAVPRHIMKAFLPGPEVLIASLGQDVVPVGALHLARQGCSIDANG